MTAKDAYETDPTFRALVDVWVAERRCPLVLKDRCLELDLPRAAECAEWAATERDREVYFSPTSDAARYGVDMTPCGPFPSYSTTGVWYWYVNTRHLYQANSVHADRVNRSQPRLTRPRDAILWLLNNWKVRAVTAKPKKARTVSKKKPKQAARRSDYRG